MERAAADDNTPNTPVAAVQSSCVNCDRPDNVDNFVQCDTCDSWWHQSCAGVTASVAERSWNCRLCFIEVSSTRTTSSVTRSARIALQFEKLKEQREMEKKFIEEKYKLLETEFDIMEETGSHRSRVSKQASIEQVRKWIDKSAGQAEGIADPIGDKTVASSSLPLASLNQGEAAATRTVESVPPLATVEQVSPLKHPSISLPVRRPTRASERPVEAVHTSGAVGSVSVVGAPALPMEVKQQPTLDQNHPSSVIPEIQSQQPWELPAPAVSKGAIPKRQPKQQNDSMVKVGSNVPHPPVQQQGKPDQTLFDTHSAQLRAEYENLHHLIKQFGNMIKSQSLSNHPRNTTPLARETIPTSHAQPNTASLFGNVPIRTDPLGVSEYIPTPSQLAARQVMPRDLPQFSGNPADWPVFLSSFKNTTLACGYTSAENLCRLQRSLKGAAYDSVQSRLLLPESVPHVLDTLYLLYGRPELLIHALLEKVHSVPAPKVDKLETLIDFGMAVQSLCDHLEAAGQLAHLSNPTLLMELVGKLPAHIKMEWGTYLRNFPEVNLKTFGDFMSNVVISASKVTVYSGINSKSGLGDKLKPKHRVNAHSDEAEEVRLKEMLCYACRKPGHRLQECRTFKSLSVDDRWRCIQTSGLCRNCLGGHGRRSCRRSSCCGTNGCQYRHHPLLHPVRTHASFSRPVSSGENHTHRQMEQCVYFRIVPITVYGPCAVINTFAFLDDGSSLTLIEEKMAEQLGITGENKPLCLAWTGNVTRVETASQQLSLSISAAGSQKKYTLDDTRTVEELSLPKQTLSYGVLADKYHHLRGLPVASYVDAVPRVLIGVNNLNLIVPVKVKEGNNREPVAAKTRLGWCIYGGHRERDTAQTLNCHSCGCTNDDDLHNTVKEYFALEDVATKLTISLLSDEEKRAQQVLEQTTVRVGKRFETGLLWKYDHIQFPDSYSMALRRLQCLEKRMDRDPKLRENLRRQLVEYQEKGYTHRTTEAELISADKERIWYLPLGAVTNPRNPEKVRLIWDAAAKVGGIALNTFLLKGPDQLTSLPAVLARFRQFMVAVSADIKEMFHQVLIRKADRQSLRFLWRNDPSSPPDIYVMDVAIFGAACSPASAQYVKNKNAKEFEEKYPRAVEGIVKNHYVDDSLESYGSVEEAIQVSDEMRMIHENGGFQLRNWLSNSQEVLNRLGETQPPSDKNIGPDKKEFERVLGMLWLTKEDEMCLSTAVQEPIQRLMDRGERPTKRQVLKCLMGFFDPLGLWSVFHVHGKILLQDVWRSGTQWDEKINDATFDRWQKWTSLFQTIGEIRIQRCYFENATIQHYQSLQLHIFVDASEVAYSAVAYFRIRNPSGVFECNLVAAKTKVAPLKPLSVPRLELQAAVLGVRLMQFVEESHTVKIQQRFLWSDSATVLAWLRADHRRYKQFVACRVGEILMASNVHEWQWVPSKLNPADVATKWGKGPCPEVTRVWFNGPEFLKYPESDWPHQKSVTLSTEEELRPCLAHHYVSVPSMVFDLERFSLLSRLIRAAAYIHRCFENRRRKTKGEPSIAGHLESEELQKGQRTLIWLTQWQAFPDEMVLLTRNQHGLVGQQQLERSSSLYKLSPVLDEFGILRMDGRIAAAPNVTENTKFPIILPRKHKFTHLLLDDYHRRYRHCNSETVVNEVRQQYYVPQLRVAVKQVARACQWCKIFKAEPCIPRMAPLPMARLASFQKPFTHTGLDLFGPMLVKVGRSNSKRWIAVFTCLTIRAVHVEVVSSLSTGSCVKAIRRFVVRRGSPATIYSDNGTNFQGASRLLREQIEQLAETFTSASTKWIFIPPGTPHMGGAWERMVRSIKTAMEAAYNSHGKLDDEALETLVVEAEGIVNSRPLTYLPIASGESEALTPNHLLLGSSNGMHHPTEENGALDAVLQTSWKQIQLHLDTFWRRWVREYLPTLTKRTKWFGDVKAIATGDLVVIVDMSSRNNWERGRILEVIRAGDGRIRQAIVQTARGLVRRSVAKLALLEVDGGGKTGTGSQCYGGEDVDTGNTSKTG